MATPLFDHDVAVAMTAPNCQITIGAFDAVLVTHGPDAGLVADPLSAGRKWRGYCACESNRRHRGKEQSHFLSPCLLLKLVNALTTRSFLFHRLPMPDLAFSFLYWN